LNSPNFISSIGPSNYTYVRDYYPLEKRREIITNPKFIQSTNENNIDSLKEAEHGKLITPYDLKWSKLMSIAVTVLSFQKSFGNTNRFLNDFVALVKSHNFRWLPESPINALNTNNKNSILRRIDSAIIEVTKNDSDIKVKEEHFSDFCNSLNEIVIDREFFLYIADEIYEIINDSLLIGTFDGSVDVLAQMRNILGRDANLSSNEYVLKKEWFNF
jgi:hypothetical protein